MNTLTPRRVGFTAAFAALGLLLTGGAGVRAQSALSLVPGTVSGTTVTLAVALTGGTNLTGFDFNVTLDPAYLSFVGTSPFAGTAIPFDTPLMNELTDPSTLRVAYGQSGPAVDNPGFRFLGTFSVNLVQPLPASGTFVTFGPIGDPAAPTNGSQVYDAGGNNVLSSVAGARLTPPAAVPEASSVVSLALLLLALGGLAVSRRRVRSAPQE